MIREANHCFAYGKSMKKPTLADNGKEKYGERKKEAHKNDESLFIIIPIEVIDSIVARKRFFLWYSWKTCP
jgi:hypothetical protein